MVERNGRQLGKLHDHRPFIHHRQECLARESIGNAGQRKADPGNGEDPALAGKRTFQQRVVARGNLAHQPWFMMLPIRVRLHFEQVKRQYRHQRERQHQRRGEGQHDGQRHRAEQLAFQSLQREQRQEYDGDDRKAISDRLCHFGHGDEYITQLARCRVLRIGQPLDHILDHHNRAVDKDAHRNGKPAKAHQIGGQADGAHEDERQQDRHRQCQRDDDRGAHIAQKQKQQDHHQHGGFEQRGFHRANRAGDQVRPVVKHVNAGAFGQAWPDFGKPRLHAFDHFGSIRTAQADNQPLNRLARAVLAHRTIAGEAADAHLCHIADAHHRTAGRTHDNGGKIIKTADRSGGAHDQRLFPVAQPARAIVAVARFYRADQIGGGKSGRRQRRAIGHNFEGFGKAAQ